MGICGLGTVGQGVWKHLERSRAALESRLGVRLDSHSAGGPRPEKAARRPRPRRPSSRPTPLAVATDPGHPHCLRADRRHRRSRARSRWPRCGQGKIVVSANKALLCAHGAEIFAAARRHGGHFFFEASVAGGIPIIKALREGLVANRFGLIYGILNGTCNYILTRMERPRAALRAKSSPTPNAWATPRPTSRSTSRAGTPRTRPASWPGLRTALGADADQMIVEGIDPHHPGRPSVRARAGLWHQAAGRHHPRFHQTASCVCGCTRRCCRPRA